MRGDDIFQHGDSSSSNQYSKVAFGVVVVLALGFGLWRFDAVTSGSAGSALERTPPPSVQQSSDLDLVANQFRPYTDAVPVVSLPEIRDDETVGGVTSAVLAAQVELLDSAGFTSIDERAVRDVAMGRNTEATINPILLTFDGAKRSQWTDVDPILEEHQFSALLFLRPEDVTGPDDQRELDRRTLQSMKSSGRWSFGVQVAPGSLRRRSGEALLVWEARVRTELETARRAIDQALDVHAISFAYPYTEWGLPQVDRAVEKRLPELIGEQFDLAFLDTDQSVVVTSASDKSLAPRIPRSRTSTNPAALLGAIDESIPRSAANQIRSIEWSETGDGSCSSSEDSLMISADSNTTCRLESGAVSMWRDLALSGVVTGLAPASSLTFHLRALPSSQIDLRLMNDSVMVQRRREGVWSQIGWSSFERVDAEDPVAFHVHLAGSRLEVTVGGSLLISVGLGAGSEPGQMSVTLDVDEATEIALTQFVIMSDRPM